MSGGQHTGISVSALKAGDRAEFARFVESFSTPIYRLGLKMLGNPQDAEDILQETFLKAYKALPDFKERSSLSTWLYRIAVNEALMLLRRRRPEPVSIDDDIEGEEGEVGSIELEDWCCLPEKELLSSEGRRFLDQAIQNLSPALRIVFILRDIEGLSIHETAEAINLTKTVVKTRLLRARLALRQQLSTYYGERFVESKRK